MREVDLGNGLSVKVQVKHTDNEEINYGDVTVIGLRDRTELTKTERAQVFALNISVDSSAILC
jgi:hypothetical protein